MGGGDLCWIEFGDGICFFVVVIVDGDLDVGGE